MLKYIVLRDDFKYLLIQCLFCASRSVRLEISVNLQSDLILRRVLDA